MRILGADLAADLPGRERAQRTLVLVDDEGRIVSVRQPGSIAETATHVGELAGGEPFLLGADLPVIVPARPSRLRPVDALIRRRLGHPIAPGGRAALQPERGGVAGEALLAALAATGHPCLPFPDRDMRTSGVAEVHPGLVLKCLLWERSSLSSAADPESREMLFRGMEPPAYGPSPRAAPWPERAGMLEIVLRALGEPVGYDLRPPRERLATVASEEDLEAAVSLFHAAVIAGTSRRYLIAPETCLFLGDRESGYTISPADGFVRRLVLREGRRPGRAHLFPRASLRERLGEVADLRSADLLEVPGRPRRIEAHFRQSPVYEFDNLDEMLWWKHCRHLAGPVLPIEGLTEMMVTLGEGGSPPEDGSPLRLVRSRHRTLSFRFEPPGAWRARVPPRDGRVYPIRVLRAVYETA